MATSVAAVQELLFSWLSANVTAETTPAEMTSDSFYTDFMSGVPAEDLPVYQEVVNLVKAAATAKAG